MSISYKYGTIWPLSSAAVLRYVVRSTVWDLKYFVIMDETAVFVEAKAKTTVNQRGVRTIPARDSGSNAKRATFCLAIAADGTKPLPPFLKGSPGARIQKKT